MKVEPSRRISDFSLYRRLIAEARPYWPHILALGLVNLVATPLALLTPLPLKIAVDSILGSHPLPAFYRAVLPADASSTSALALTAGIMLGITALSYMQTFGAWLLQTWAGEKLILDFRARLFRHLQRLSLSYHDMRGTADSAYRIQYDAPSIQKIAVEGVMPLISAAFTLAGMIWITARLDWQLAVVAVAVTPPLALLSRWSRLRLREGWKTVKKLDSSAFSVVHEVLGAVRVVKSFTREDHEEQRFIHRSSLRIRELIRVTLLQTGFDSSVGLLIAAGTAVSLFIGVQHVRAGTLSLGGLLLVMAYVGQLYEPLRTMSRKVADFQSSLAGAERAFALLDELPDVPELPDARPIARARGEVEFQDVSFSYTGGRPVHMNLSFEVPAGSRVGITGITGAGKTTLLNLLMRFYDPTEGAVLLDGIDVKECRLNDLRNQFALVQQEPVLFSTSIAENIAYARPGASQAEIEAAARAANIHDFMCTLPDGYDTLVGERGMRLSGGERQRISLARAFLKDAPILLLDEPTSSVDLKTEALIVESLDRLMKGRTTFMVAHRLSTLEICDVRLRIEYGRLVESDEPSLVSG